ncbi:MAG: hypothetical protein IT426_03710 [Pirellulales bacterium]|nr:hypothetical protein [Pirellulales bacterium]
MCKFTRTNLIVGGIVLAGLLQVEAALAQIAPRRNLGGNRGGGYYGGYDTFIYPDINQTNAAYQQANTQSREYQAQTSMARSSAWRNINQSVAQQANAQTQSMLAQRQSSKDWWYAQQSRQLAESKARSSYQPMNLPTGGYAEPAAPAQAPAEREIMIWPTLLKSAAFDELRAKVEAPFRRASADKQPLTADDYRGILQAIDEMKTKLSGMASQIVEAEYAAVEGYLNELAADARKRLEARLSPKPATEKMEAPETKP